MNTWKLATQSWYCVKPAWQEDVASKLINDLLHDLKSFRNLNSARAQALTSIRLLALCLDRPQSPRAREWEAADQAAEAWCRNAYL